MEKKEEQEEEEQKEEEEVVDFASFICFKSLYAWFFLFLMQKVQETSSLYCMNSMTNWSTMITHNQGHYYKPLLSWVYYHVALYLRSLIIFGQTLYI